MIKAKVKIMVAVGKYLMPDQLGELDANIETTLVANGSAMYATEEDGIPTIIHKGVGDLSTEGLSHGVSAQSQEANYQDILSSNRVLKDDVARLTTENSEKDIALNEATKSVEASEKKIAELTTLVASLEHTIESSTPVGDTEVVEPKKESPTKPKKSGK